MSSEKILVIKLSALGDFILALGAMAAIRKHHPQAHITLLTTRAYADLGHQSGYFNDVIIDPRPKAYNLPGWFYLQRRLKGFTRVYDLQNNQRSAIYRSLFLGGAQWVGENADMKSLHAFTRHQRALKAAGIDVTIPDISWLASDTSFVNLKKPYVLLMPGAAPQHPAKRWSATSYGALALKLERDGFQPVLIGTQADSDSTDRIKKICEGAVDLCGHTSLADIATLARGAAGAIGNDTGPMHLAALAGCKTLSLFCLQESDPERSAPVGEKARVLASDQLDDISVSDVYTLFHDAA